MKTIVALILSSVPLLAGLHFPAPSFDWTACNTAGKSVPVYLHPGDLGTLDLPQYGDRPTYVAFFTTQNETNVLGDLRGKVITARFRVEADTTTTYGIGFGNGPATIRLYFTSVAGNFDFNDSDSKHPSSYWWNGPSAITFDTADGFTDVTLTATMSIAGGWTDSHSGTDLTAFAAAASNVRQIGFSFGGTDKNWEVGANAVCPVGKEATVHIWSITAQ